MAVKYCVKVLQNQCTARLTPCSKSTVYLKYYGIQCTSMEPSCYSRSILHQTPIFPEFFQLPTFHVVVKTNSRKNEKGFFKKSVQFPKSAKLDPNFKILASIES